ncbi:MAG: sigma factor, partial [Planctomycetaceae bacterium]|nr:sigma factor [Planctomycetaceae bacterium]
MTDRNVTLLLESMEQGDSGASERLLPLVYEELHRLARQKMAHEAPEHTLQPTALVHEAYLRLVGDRASPKWENRGHFYAAAAEAMRRILIEAARRKASLKRGSGRLRVEFSEDVAQAESESPDSLLSLNSALEKL